MLLSLCQSFMTGCGDGRFLIAAAKRTGLLPSHSPCPCVVLLSCLVLFWSLSFFAFVFLRFSLALTHYVVCCLLSCLVCLVPSEIGIGIACFAWSYLGLVSLLVSLVMTRQDVRKTRYGKTRQDFRPPAILPRQGEDKTRQDKTHDKGQNMSKQDGIRGEKLKR
jgi:hypothetical protein